MAQTAQEFCRAAAGKKKGMQLPEINPVAAIIKAFKGGNKGKASNSSLTSNKALALAVSRTDAKCSGGANVNQKNVIDTTKCSIALKCGDPGQIKGMTAAERKDWLAYKTELCTLRNVTQTNSSKARVDCQTSQLISQLASQKLTAESLATLERVMQSSGVLTKNEAVTDNCAAVSNDISAQQFASSYQECVKNLGFNQSNTLVSCGSKINQGNTADALAKCVMQAASSSEMNQDAKGSAKSDTNEKYKADLVTMGSASSCIMLASVSLCAMYLFWNERRGNGGNAQ